jgi:hypothetical protein
MNDGQEEALILIRPSFTLVMNNLKRITYQFDLLHRIENLT